MHGNVWEWCWDWYDPDYYTTSDARGTNPDGPDKSTNDSRVTRGGSWYGYAVEMRSAARGYFTASANTRYGYIGFRVVRNLF
jgi:formylglycine-generating enzyme required for sulfatase activity